MVVYVFIDASNVWEAQKAKGRFFDLQKLKKFLAKEYAAKELKIYYYTAFPAQGTREYSLDGRHKFYYVLEHVLGFVVRKKELKRIEVEEYKGRKYREKGNMDVEMTIDVVQELKNFDVAVLFSGDCDFLALVNLVRSVGKKVYIYSSRNNISSELRTGADGYTDVLNIKADVWGKEIVRRKGP
jgi:uncharacterized LabA/DUF88 family protein